MITKLLVFRYLNGGNPTAKKKLDDVGEWLLDKDPNVIVPTALELIDRYDLTQLNEHRAIELINRYDYCSRWSVAPYPRYEDQTSEWREFERIVNSCKSEYYKYKKDMNNG